MALASDHRHCRICGKVTPPDSETCSAECAARREQRLRSSRNYRYLLYGSIAILLIVLASGFLR